MHARTMTGRTLGIGSERAQRQVEIGLLEKLRSRLNASGLPLPAAANQPGLMGRLENLRLALEGVDRWMPMDIMPLAALAQHYGMPTRLLDWSTSHLIASYFAASGALAATYREHGAVPPHGIGVSGDLAVWRLDAARTGPSTSPLRVFYPPYADNANLSAQKGLFTYWEAGEVNLDDPADVRPLDELIKVWHQPNILLKVQLPRALAGNLLVLLERRGIDAATVFPGYSGGVEAVRETEIAELSTVAEPYDG